ncbi:AI-2E family transporter [Caproiciproducens faecalis]|uniref:AI-2E family transporter n=1 Tax=Caproiciproducens faecalis TaxID=2820301 RepID=A0ABS7DJA9_9FIRM|nr:AI-2E family transporter [Caproiciproducens faecalis]MBW7571375.1 AI-2E family transporter [Caproiciproducens faecalis]
MELNKSNMKKIALLIAFSIALYLGLKNLYRFSELAGIVAGIFEPILLGLAITFILNVLMRQVESRLLAPINRRYTKNWPKVRRSISILITFLIVIGIIALILLILIPELVRTITSLTNNIPSFFTELQNNLVSMENKYPAVREYVSNIRIDWTNISQMLAQYGQKLANTLVGSTVTVAANLFHALITLVLGLVFSINILVQKEKLEAQTKRFLFAYFPVKPAETIVRVCSLTNRAFSNFIAGQCTEACILGSLCFIGMQIFRFPYALLVSVIVAFMALIPIFGAFLSTCIGALLILVVNPIQAVWFIVFFVVLQQLEGNLIFPRVVGSKVGLPALWVLAAVTIGGNAFGLVGMLVNIPLCAVMYTLLRENVNKRLEEKKLKRQLPKEE